MKKKITIVGASGFIGRHLQNALEENDIQIVKGRNVNQYSTEKLARIIDGQDVVINLAGSSLFGYWTKSKKKKIQESRIDLTTKLVRSFSSCEKKPSHFINASAIGIYTEDKLMNEKEYKTDKDFLANVVKDWEKAAFSAKKNKIPTTIIRLGVVFGSDGGSYKILRTLTKYNLGVYFGDGKQSLSFISIYDVEKAVKFIIDRRLEGIINLTAPESTNFIYFLKKLKKSVNAFIIWRIPTFILKMFFGEASVIILKSQQIQPFVLLNNNFKFVASDIDQCIHLIENS